MNQFRRSTFAFAALLSLITACGGTEIIVPIDTTKPTPPPPPPPVVAAVQVLAPARLTVGRTGTATAVARTSLNVEVTGKTFTWSSSNAAAVTVSAAGILTAVGPGSATISASVDGITGTASVLSTDASLFSLTVSPASSSILLGETKQLTIAGKDSSGAAVAVRSTTWTTSNPGVATVSSTGLVTSRGIGTASIRVEGVTNSAETATAIITVAPVPVASVVIAPMDTILRFRFPRSVVASARDSVGGVLVRPITYSTSNVDVATLDDFGLVTATGEGPVTITARSEGKSASVRLFVIPDSGAYLVVLGGVAGDFVTGAIDIPNATAPATQTKTIAADTTTRFTITASNGSYRARAFTTGDPARVGTTLSGIALKLAGTAVQPLTLGPPAVLFPLSLKPYTANITAPASAPVNSVVTVTWTFDESTAPFSFAPDAVPNGRVYISTTNGADLTGTPVAATVTRDPATGISTFSASFTMPSTPGPLYFQVVGDGALTTLLFPIKFLGVPFRVINGQ